MCKLNCAKSNAHVPEELSNEGVIPREIFFKDLSSTLKYDQLREFIPWEQKKPREKIRSDCKAVLTN